IPTKALLRSSEIWHLMHRLNEFGFSADNFKFDLAKIVERSRKVSKQLSNGVAFLMKKHKITVISGEAKLAGAGKIAVAKEGKTTEYGGKNIVLATGARARALLEDWQRALAGFVKVMPKDYKRMLACIERAPALAVVPAIRP
ncbi:MAG: FAD-dependent oxidoreductase, partial [Chthoniobacterales bacterium]